MSQSVFCKVLQYETSDNVDEFIPVSILRTAFREMPLRSAATCCDKLIASLEALRFSPKTLSISSRVLYIIIFPIRTVDCDSIS